MKKIIVSMAAVCAFSVPMLASADETKVGTVEQQVKITYSPQMAATAEGRKQLERRIRQAAKEVCGPQDQRRAGSVTQMTANRLCYRQAVAEAMNAIKVSGLAAMD